jgi:serine/threonine protein kinase
MHRDIKADYVGFDARGSVKLFDFGLATELEDVDYIQAIGAYTMTGGCGSLRYIAPENYFRGPYNLSADVYSFCIPMWEIISVERAYTGMSVQDVTQKVIVQATHRPSPILNAQEWGPELVHVVTHGWHKVPKCRPRMSVIIRVLKKLLLEPSTQRRSSLLMTSSSRKRAGPIKTKQADLAKLNRR